MRYKKVLFTATLAILIAGRAVEAKEPDSAARRILLHLASYFPEMKDVALPEKETLLATDFSYFGIKRKDGNAGYFILDNGGRLEEFGVSSPYNNEEASGAARAAAQRCVGKERSLGEPRCLYLGPAHYFLKYPILYNMEEVGEITVDLINKRITDATLVFEEKRGSRKKRRRASPPTLLEEVPNYHYFLSGEATALAMIVGYWENKGLGGLREISPSNPSQKESNEDLIAALNRACGSCLEAATIEIFAASRGYRLKANYLSCSAENPEKRATWQTVTDEIEAKRPFLIRINSAGISHYAVAMGYWESEMGNFVCCRVPGLEKAEGGGEALFFFNWDADYDELYLTTIMPEKARGERGE